jgi:hypothetical protein
MNNQNNINHDAIRDYFFKYVNNTSRLVQLIANVREQIIPKYKEVECDIFSEKALKYHIYKSKNKYHTFWIPKKSGGKREIIYPNKKLKKIQRSMNIILQSIYSPSKASHGFEKERSIITNAKHHINKNYVYNIDIENFFPSIHQLRIWKRLQVEPYNLNNEVADLISNLVCYQYDDNRNSAKIEDIDTTVEIIGVGLVDFKEKDNQYQTQKLCNTNGKNIKKFLPQGAPTSPIIANMICQRLDRRLLGLAKRFNVVYTRYADDMTFSSNHNVYQNNSDFIQELHRLIKNENFVINQNKTRLQKKNRRQQVTGIIVNKKLNVSRKYIKQLRTLIYLLERYGIKKSEMIFAKKHKSSNKYASIIKTTQGKLRYLRMVKGNNDAAYIKLNQRFEKCFFKDLKKKDHLMTTYEYNQLKYHAPYKMVSIIQSIQKIIKIIERDRINIEMVHKNQLYFLSTIFDMNNWEKIDRIERFNINKRFLGVLYPLSKPKWNNETCDALKKRLEISPSNNLYNLCIESSLEIKNKPSVEIDSDTKNTLENISFFIDTIHLKQILKQVFYTIDYNPIYSRIHLKTIKTRNYIELLFFTKGLCFTKDELCDNKIIFTKGLFENIYQHEKDYQDHLFRLFSELMFSTGDCRIETINILRQRNTKHILGESEYTYNILDLTDNNDTLVLRFYM